MAVKIAITRFFGTLIIKGPMPAYYPFGLWARRVFLWVAVKNIVKIVNGLSRTLRVGCSSERAA